VLNHDTVLEKDVPIRVRVTHYNDLVSPQRLDGPAKVRLDSLRGTPPFTATQTLYDKGIVSVGFWSCTPGSFRGTSPRTTTECFHVLEGDFLLTDHHTGSIQHCVAGDTIVLPKGWCGHWDVVQTVKKIWAVVE
jgi:uncharacterized cupin superfamily protein